MVDDGANTPASHVVQFSAGANGTILCSDNTFSSGLRWKPVIPTTVSADKAIPRFNGATGTPVPLQDSKLIITDDGAIQSTPGGGNARGTQAVDLQVVRSNANQAATGLQAVIGGGASNRASGQQSVVAGGNGNSATGVEDTVSGGQNNTANGGGSNVAGGQGNSSSGQNAAVGGGNGNSASSQYATVAGGGSNSASNTGACVTGGNNNVASGSQSSCLGGLNNTAFGWNSTTVGGSRCYVDKNGQVGQASGFFAANGDAQVSVMVVRGITVDNSTTVVLTLDGANPPNGFGLSLLTIPNNTAWNFDVNIIGRSTAGASAFYNFTGGIKNNGGVTALIGSVTAGAAAEDAGMTTAVASVIADAVNNALSVTIKGPSATNCRWVARVRVVEVSGIGF